jgi:hypothetical protein
VNKKMLLLALLFLSLMLSTLAYGQDSSIVITTDRSGYSNYDASNPGWGGDGSFSMTTGKSDYHSNYPGGYPGMQQNGYDTTLAPINTEQQSPDSLIQYQEFYSFDQRTQTQAGPVQFDIYRSEPTYLIINGQSQPYSPNFVPYNSLWIQGTTRWTQYIQCPINARFKLLAFSQGGPATVVELYPNNGYQTVNNYQFYPGYTQFFFWADVVGRHTLNFYTNGQKSNSVVVDVVPYSGTYTGPYNGVVQNPVGPSSTRTVSISIGVTGQGATETPQGNPQQPEPSGTGNQGSGQTTSGGQGSGCPCLGEKCICETYTCENGKTFPQWSGKVVDKKTYPRPGMVEGKCYCDCEGCDTCAEFRDFVESQCGEVRGGWSIPLETSCSATGVDTNNNGGSNTGTSAPGTISTDSQDQGFMSDVPQGEAI